jgi:hypothetical protein
MHHQEHVKGNRDGPVQFGGDFQKQTEQNQTASLTLISGLGLQYSNPPFSSHFFFTYRNAMSMFPGSKPRVE